MQVIPVVVTPALHAGLVQGELDALRRLFEACAPALVEAADGEVHASQSAAHVTEHLFERAWNQRAEFATADALRDWLVTENHAMALRESSRRIALHKHGGEYPAPESHALAAPAAYDIADGWHRLVARIEAAAADPAEAAARRRVASRHGAAVHMARVGRGVSRRVMIGGTLALVAGITVLIVILDRGSAEYKVVHALNDRAAQTILTHGGQRGDAKLVDGTVAALGADAALTIPAAFNRDFRAVKVRGAARFTVATHPRLPFDVRVGSMRVVAMGTIFTVQAYDEDLPVVIVQEGSVKVMVGEFERVLAAGGAATVSATGQIIDVPANVRDEALAWTEGRLQVADRPLRDVLPLLRRWYALDLRPDSSLMARPVTLSARLGHADSAIVALERAAKVKQIWVQKQMVLVNDPGPGRP